MKCSRNTFQFAKIDHDIHKIKIWKDAIHSLCSEDRIEYTALLHK